MTTIDLVCHDCATVFETQVDNPWGTYEFTRCPACGSARTTLATEPEKS